MKKILKELEEEYSDLINDKNLQDISEWKSPIDIMKPMDKFESDDLEFRVKKGRDSV